MKTFVFGSFREAMGFIVRISYEAGGYESPSGDHKTYTIGWPSASPPTMRVAESQKRDAKLARKIENISWLTYYFGKDRHGME